MATHLADTSALVRVHHDDVGARLEPMFIGGRIATCAIVDLEILVATRSGSDHDDVWFERQLLPRAPISEACTNRAIDVQGLLAQRGHHRGVSISDLIIAAAAELAGLVVVHYDHDFDLIAEITGQQMEWVVPRGTVP